MTRAVVRRPGISRIVRSGTSVRPVESSARASRTARMASAMVTFRRISSVGMHLRGFGELIGVSSGPILPSVDSRARVEYP